MFDPTLFLGKLLATAIQGSVLLGLVWFASSRILFVKPRVRVALWAVAFGHFLIALFVKVPVPVLPQKHTSAQGSSTLATYTNPSYLISSLIVLWMIGVGVCLLLQIWRDWQFRKMLRTCANRSSELEALAGAVAKRLRLKNAPMVYISPCAKIPCVAGLFRPVVFWPARLEGKLDEVAIEAILAHELAHVKNGDLAVGWLAAVVRAVFFFNPFLWIASREFSIQSEMLCDRDALSVSKIGKRSYCSLLIDLATQSAFPPATIHAATKDFHPLYRRLNHMTIKTQKEKGAASIAVIAAICLATVVAVPLTATVRKTHEAPKAARPVDEDVVDLELVNPVNAQEIEIYEAKDGDMVKISPETIGDGKTPLIYNLPPNGRWEAGKSKDDVLVMTPRK